MKRLLAILLILTSTGCAQTRHNLASMDDVVFLSQQGLSDATILAFLQSRESNFALDADDIDRLLQAGASEKVIQYMIEQSTNAVSYIRPAVDYATPYPSYYYTPYYSSYAMSSLYFGFSSYPYYAHYNHYYGTPHHYRPRHSAYTRYAHSSDGHANGHKYNAGGGNRSGLSHAITASKGHNSSSGIGHSGYSSSYGGGHSSGYGGGHSGGGGGHSGGH